MDAVMRVLGWSTVRFLLVLVLAVQTAHAQPAPPSEEQTPPPVVETEAVKLFREGRELLDAGKFDEACTKFNESVRLDPEAPGTLLNLGLCNEKLGKTATALGWYRKVQFRSAESQMSEYELAAKQHAVVLAQHVPTLRIDAAPGVKVKLDGTELTELDRARIEVDPGPHVIEAGGERRDLILLDGEKETITFKSEAPKQYVVVDRGVSQRRNAYIATGAGAVLVIASGTLSLVGKSKYDGTDHPETYQRWQNIVRFGGTSLFVAGSAAIATGLYLYFKAPRKERVEQVAPIVSKDQLGVALVGSF